MFKKVITEKSIAEKSADALGMFRTALNNLKDVNKEADIIVEQNEATIAELQKENNELSSVVNKNLKVVSNIEKLIGV